MASALSSKRWRVDEVKAGPAGFVFAGPESLQPRKAETGTDGYSSGLRHVLKNPNAKWVHRPLKTALPCVFLPRIRI